MIVLLACLACAIAGFLNGSYAFPVKHMGTLKKETIWFYFSFFGFLIIPVTSVYLITPHAFAIISHIDSSYILALMGGGFIFGIGMVLFTLCLNKIGMGIAFIFNMSIGIMGGSLLPLLLFHRAAFFTPFGLMNLSAFILFLLAMSFCGYAIHLRDMAKSNLNIRSHKNTLSGLILGVIAGIFCAAQGFTYAYSINAFRNMAGIIGISEYSAINIPWIIMFSTTLIPYASFQLYLQIKQKTFGHLE